MSPLRNAILTHDFNQVKAILTASPSSVNETEEDGIPVSHFAALSGSFEILRYIIEYSRASLDVYDSRHQSILHYATASGDAQKCRYLVERCSMDILEADLDLITPYQIACERFPDTVYPYYLSLIHTPFPDMYHNPIRRGFFPDPSIVRVHDDYYMVNSSFIYFPCIPISHSKDLVHWSIIGHAITNPEWSELGSLEGGRGYWAPDISYDNGRFYITATYRHNDTDSILRRQMVVSSDRPEGPYSRPVFIEEDGIDPSIFHEDGRHYMLLNRGARIFELNEDCTEKISPASLLYYGSNKHAPEGPHLLKKDGYYYLFQAEGGTGPGHRITVARSKELMGIYAPCPYNPIMRQNNPDAPLQRCGHGKPVRTSDGRWYMVYLCGRSLENQFTMLGRETALDPITWTADGWPIVNHLNGPSALSPKPLPDWIPEEETASFQSDIWPADWMTPREPERDGIVPTKNGIQLCSSPAPLHSVHSRNLFLHRQESFRFQAEFTLELPELKPHQEAGILAYYDENSYVSLMAARTEDGLFWKVSERIGQESIEQKPLIAETQERIYRFLLITDGLKRTFQLKREDGTLLYSCTLNNVYYLSDEGISIGKRFTGAAFGVGAYGATPFRYLLVSAKIENH